MFKILINDIKTPPSDLVDVYIIRCKICGEKFTSLNALDCICFYCTNPDSKEATDGTT